LASQIGSGKTISIIGLVSIGQDMREQLQNLEKEAGERDI
jgi:phosphoglycerate dehydrogenase-like enzyme